MDKWQQEFSGVTSLREQWAHQFEAFTNHTLHPVFGDFEAFAVRCEIQTSTPKGQNGVRTFKFALTEDAYVLLYFRPRGVDRIEFDYECALSGVGRVEGVKTAAAADAAGREWVQSCFRMALDDLVNRFSSSASLRNVEELVPA